MENDNAVVGETYHVFNKSIAGYRIFNVDSELYSMKLRLKYYQVESLPFKFSRFVKSKKVEQYGFDECFSQISKGADKIIQIIAYCIMPTHLHLILKPLKENGFSTFINNILNSYTHYFNIKYKRKGPLWEGRTRKVLVSSDDQLLHLTRYIHLNPVTIGLVERPQDWPASSYSEYTSSEKITGAICEYADILNIGPDSYRSFVEDGILYQKELAVIKKLVFD
ncbi:MAG: transposase [Candidatus Omnitrophica bacterium]|nr:transposase [Candidatus Omnitrophota bacterium]